MPFRPKPLALLFCCSVAGLLPGVVVAQTGGPLRVDPALLGLPRPAPRAPASAPAVPAMPAPAATPAPRPAADGGGGSTTPVVRPVAAPEPLPASPVPASAASLPSPTASAPGPAAGGTSGNEPSAGGPPATEPAPGESDLPRGPVSGTGGGLPIFLVADRISGITDVEAVAEGKVDARKGDSVMRADRMTYWPLEDEVEAVGDVSLTQGFDRVSGPRMRMKMEARIGFFEQPDYYLKRVPPAVAPASSVSMTMVPPSVLPAPPRAPTEARGKAERIDFEGENRLRLFNATYTTCKPGQDDWYASADELALDYDREVGSGKGATVYFQGVPIVHSPWMSFSLNNQRKSGFLAPSFGTSSQSGIELMTPYYWNIAPSMDATISPRLLSKRGLQLNSELRYLEYNYSGHARVEFLPNDSQRDMNRYGYSLVHSQHFGQGFSGSLNLNGVSDDRYFTDLSSRVAVTSQTQLLRQGVLTYGAGWWNAQLIGQGFQTLQPDERTIVAKPYSFAPRLVFNARRPDFHDFDVALFGEYTSFIHPTQVEGKRLVAYPQIALPLVTPAFYVTPKIGVHSTHYTLSRQADGVPASISRAVPVVSVDSGVTFERNAHWFGHDTLQTLEPRLYYLYVPYRRQDQIPIFDSGLADFNFAQIFAENPFVGQDRIADASQLTAALTSRLIDPATGGELMRAMIGQRFYFRDQQVALPGQSLRRWGESDFLAAFTGQVMPKVFVDAALQYNTERARNERFSIGARYLPQAGKAFNASYRYNRDTLDQIDISGQWPIFGGWNAVGRYNYSLRENRPIETLGGLEYQAGCWVARVVGHRLATVTGGANTALFFQLELNDFSRIGSNPLDLLKRNIQGYGQINQPVADPIFGE